MPVLRIRALSRSRQARARGLPLARFALGGALLWGLSTALLMLGGAFAYSALTADLPPIESIPLLLAPRSGAWQPTRLYDRSGEHLLLSLQNPAAVDAPPLSADPAEQDHFAPALITVTLKIEDPGFWLHPGFTLGEKPSLAQRLVRTLLLADEPPGLRRDLRERLLAAQITARYGRMQVLSWYLNSANYGRLTSGANAAAHVYLGKSARDLTLQEAAMLTAVAQAPAITPFDAPALVQERTAALLQRLADSGDITPQQAAQALAGQLQFIPAAPFPPSPAPAFVQRALEDAAAYVGWERLQRGGYTIITSLDFDLQAEAQCAAQFYRQRLNGQAQAAPMLTFDGRPCEAARLLPALRVPAGLDSPGVSALLVDAQSGDVLAWVDESSEHTGSPLKGVRPPGTLLTPWVYLAGFTHGFSPASLVWDIPSGDSDPVPALDGVYDGPLRLRNALANDDLPAAARVFFLVGPENVWQTASRMGLRGVSNPLPLEQLWQGGGVSLVDAVQAFAALAHRGVQSGLPAGPQGGLQPVTVLEIRQQGEMLFAPGQERISRLVLTPALAYLLTDVLADEPARWRTMGHPNFLEIGRPAAVKTGTTLDRRDAWSVGYTPYLAGGVWVGEPLDVSEGGVQPELAAAFWHALMQYASRAYPADGWMRPADVSVVPVCNPSGLLPTEDCPDVVNEVFLHGTEPTHADTLFRRLEINRENGLLATIHTPPELVEQRVYLIVPPEAAAWALQAGLPTPPQTYDDVALSAGSSPQVRLTSPASFAYLDGQVTIRGTASGDDFERFWVQVGAGLNPTSWVQVGQAHTSPVEEGTLAVWDTTGLDGVYTIRLVVMRADARLDDAAIQVTVDNQPPDVRIVGLEDGAQVDLKTHAQMIFQAAATDNLQLAEVRFLLNGQVLDVRTAAPYQVLWQAHVGRYTLEVIATDAAGNERRERLSFEVTR
ncbi:MAG: PBP1A family penicillin-binding protein [Anaerolineales bacterium]